MIELDNKEIPVKEENSSSSIKKSQSNIAINQINENPTTKSTTSTETATTTNSQGMFRTQFEQKTKILRDAWAHRKPKITKENSKLFTIVLLTILGVCCNIAAISSNRWSCDSNISFGLWTTCYQPITDGPIWASSKNATSQNETSTQPIKCAKQGLRWVEIEMAEQSRIDQVYASQGLLVSGCILYIVSLFTICLSYWFHQSGQNLNQLRNTLIASVSLQFITYFLMLIGFYLFILTEQFSVSVGLLFVYFGLAMFASNTTNFITVEYKTFKSRLQSST